VMSRGRETDDALVDAARHATDGDSRAFEQLVLRHMEHVVTNCRYLTRAPADAEDLAQEVFVRAYFGLSGFEGRASFRSWLQRIKVNHCLDFLSRNAGKSFVSIEDEGIAERPEFWRYWRDLPPKGKLGLFLSAWYSRNFLSWSS